MCHEYFHFVREIAKWNIGRKDNAQQFTPAGRKPWTFEVHAQTTADSLAFDVQKQRAGELVRTASSVREGTDDRRVQELVGQLELILREIAHLDEGTDVASVEVIRSRVSREGVLLRINLEQMRAEKTAHDGPID